VSVLSLKLNKNGLAVLYATRWVTYNFRWAESLIVFTQWFC